MRRSFFIFSVAFISLSLIVFNASAFSVGLTVTQESDSGSGAAGAAAAAPAPVVVPPPTVPPTVPPVVPEIITPEVPPAVPEVPPEVITPEVPPTVPEVIPEVTPEIVPIVNAVETAVQNIVQVSSFVLDKVQAFAEHPVTSIINVSKATTEATRKFVESPAGKVVTGVAKPLGVATGVAIVTTQAVLTTGMMTVTSLSDVYLLILRLLGVLIGTSKRRGKPWGTVYDAVTKRPLDPAYVTVSKTTGEEVADAITDLDGRYGFLVPSGVYKLKASKTNYSFPTKTLEGKTSDELYSNIYHGEELILKEGEVLIENIPLDPVGFDWNEFAKNKQNLFRIYSDREKLWNRFFDVIYVAGLLSAIITTIFDPKITNFIFLVFYTFFVIYNLFAKKGKKAIVVRNAQTLMPVPYAVVKVFIAELNNQVKTAVSDHLGRFYFLVGPGKYYVTVDEKQLDGTYKTIHKSEPMELKKGILSGDILV